MLRECGLFFAYLSLCEPECDVMPRRLLNPCSSLTSLYRLELMSDEIDLDCELSMRLMTRSN